MQQLRSLAQMNDEVAAFYQKARHDDILLRCILPWKKGATNYIPADGSEELMMDRRRTSLVAHEIEDERQLDKAG